MTTQNRLLKALRQIEIAANTGVINVGKMKQLFKEASAAITEASKPVKPTKVIRLTKLTSLSETAVMVTTFYDDDKLDAVIEYVAERNAIEQIIAFDLVTVHPEATMINLMNHTNYELACQSLRTKLHRVMRSKKLKREIENEKQTSRTADTSRKNRA